MAQEIIFQSTKFDSYWEAFKKTSEDAKSALETKFSDA